MVKKKAKKRKRPSKSKAVVKRLEKEEDEIGQFLIREEEELAKVLAATTKEVDEFLSENNELKKLKKEIREKPLAYTALALTLGIAIGGLLRGSD